MAWRRPGDKPLSEPMLVSLLTHICFTRPQWVNEASHCIFHASQNSFYSKMMATVQHEWDWYCIAKQHILSHHGSMCTLEHTMSQLWAWIKLYTQKNTRCLYCILVFKKKKTDKITTAPHFITWIFVNALQMFTNCFVLLFNHIITNMWDRSDNSHAPSGSQVSCIHVHSDVI